MDSILFEAQMKLEVGTDEDESIGGLGERKKSDPVISVSSPSEAAPIDRAQSTGNTRSPSPVESLFQVLPGLVDPPESTVLRLNEVHFAASERESKADSQSTTTSSSTSLYPPSAEKGGTTTPNGSPATPAPDSREKEKARKMPSADKKKAKKSSWYNIINPTYKSKCEDFKRLFKEVPDTEMLIVDYSCALQRDILVHGRLYVTQNFLCFYANIFRWETNVVIKCKDITSMTKEKTALVIPNAILCCTEHDRYFFTSFGARDKTYLMLFRIWQNALLSQPMSMQECWRWVHYSYGEELGLTSDDEDYIPPEDLARCKSMDIKSLSEAPVEEGELADPESPGSTPPNRVKSGRDLNSVCSSVISEDTKSSSSDSGSEDNVDDGEPPTCPVEGHPDMKNYLDKVFAMNIDHLFTCIFTRSEFYQELQARRKVTNLVDGTWEKSVSPMDSGDSPSPAKQKRQLNYTVALNHAMAKSCQSTEVQTLHRKTKAGKVYLVDCEITNAGVPYSESFSVKQHYCVLRVAPNQCRLRVFATVEYKKSTWGLVRSIIEKNTAQGVGDYCGDLQKALVKEAQRLASDTGAVPVPQDNAQVENSADTGSLSGSGSQSTADGVTQTHIGHATILRLCLILLVLLLACNIYLAHSLWSRGPDLNTLDFGDVLSSNQPTTVDQWRRAFEQNQARHRKQLTDMSKVLDRGLSGLENMKRVFEQMKIVISSRLASMPSDSSKEEL